MNQNPYSPGLHRLVTLHVKNPEKLISSKGFLAATDSLLEKYGLEKVGLVCHDFDNDSYTVAVCLKESHICIHTWPEYSQLTLDVYLCNYLQDNTEKVNAVMEDYIAYFDAETIKDFNIYR